MSCINIITGIIKLMTNIIKEHPLPHALFSWHEMRPSFICDPMESTPTCQPAVRVRLSGEAAFHTL